MKIGIPKEIKIQEGRVALIPSFAANLVRQGHTVLVETNAGVGSGFSDAEYQKAGATIVKTADEVWSQAELIVKVKEPLESEYKKIRENQVLFTYLHLAPDVALTDALLQSKVIGIAYETVTDGCGRLPLLSPMSTIAGRMSVLVAANLLQISYGGMGSLPSGVPGVPPSKVLILGGGNVGQNAAFIANGIGADVTVFDNYTPTLERVTERFNGKVKTAYSTLDNIAKQIKEADIVIGAALIRGASTPMLVTKDMVQTMKKGSVIVDVAIDQGGCCETSHPTTHDKPCFNVNGVVHYCVTNMPGAYAQTATIFLNNATYPFIEQLANKGCDAALRENANLRNGLNVYKGQLTYKGVADSQPDQHRTFVKPEKVLNMCSMCA